MKNGHPKGNGKHVAKQPASNGKIPGGVTGKGFKPGQSGNPAGRKPRAETLGGAVRDFADSLAPGDKAGRTRLEVLIARLYREDPKTFLAYGFGKPVEAVELSIAEAEKPELVLRVRPEDLP